MKTIRAYTFEEHPNKEAVLSWVRDNWHDLSQHVIDEFIDSMREAGKRLGGKIDFCVSAVPDRGEFIRFIDLDVDEAKRLLELDCPLTGVYCDYDVLQAVANNTPEIILNAIHNESEYIHSDEALGEFLDCNKYYFFENGNFCA